MTSIYSFFASLLALRQEFRSLPKLEDFPFDKTLLACRNRGSFPDLILRLEQEGDKYFGGELIELKDSRSYCVPLELYKQLAIFTFRHPLNGPFLAFQVAI